jgi:hypothetical protein
MLVTRLPRKSSFTALPRSVADYLAAAGIVKICVVRNADGTWGLRIAHDIGSHGEDVVHAFWVADKAAANAVVHSAVSVAGVEPTEKATLDALFRAAAKQSVRLSPHDAVIARATTAAARLDASLDAASAEGGLKRFHGEYRRRRVEAAAKGQSFMSFARAQRRFRRAIVVRLLNDGVGADLFDEVFHG